MALHPRLRALSFLEQRLPQRPVSALTPETAREDFARTIRLGTALVFGRRRSMAEVRDVAIRIGTGGKNDPERTLPARLYRPAFTAEAAPLVVFFHGGGWVLGSIDTHDKMARSLAFRSRCAVLSVGYRLAPEHPFPEPSEDAYAALCWAHEHADDFHLDGSRLAVAGDSAGGNLSAVVSMMARDRGGPTIRTQVLFYPGLDTRLSSPSYAEFGEGQWLSAARARWFRDQYACKTTDLSQPYLSPLQAPDLSRLPEALIMTAENDVLRDEAEAYHARLREAGVDSELFRFPGMIHGFSMMEGLLSEAVRSMAMAGRHLVRTLRPPPVALGIQLRILSDPHRR
jgi:acetyl esterase